MRSFALALRASTFCIFGALTMSAALAQQAPAAPAAPAPARVELSPAHLALAVDVVKLSGMSRSIDIIVPQMVDKARLLFTQMRPEISGTLEKSIADLQPEFEVQKRLALDIAGRAYGSRLSEAELKDLQAFFKSASGKKFVESQPGILDDMFKNMDAFTQQLSQVVVDKLREDLKAKGVPF